MVGSVWILPTFRSCRCITFTLREKEALRILVFRCWQRENRVMGLPMQGVAGMSEGGDNEIGNHLDDRERETSERRVNGHQRRKPVKGGRKRTAFGKKRRKKTVGESCSDGEQYERRVGIINCSEGGDSSCNSTKGFIGGTALRHTRKAKKQTL